MRKPRSRHWFQTALLAVMFLAPAAHAQAPNAGRPENPEADKFVDRGIALRAQGKDNEALKAFEKAAEIDPDSVRVQIHLATVYQALGNWLLADEYLSMALSRSNHPYVNRHRQALEDAKRVIDANIGKLEVEGGPPGSEVRLNGRLVGTLPLAEPVRTTVGSYTLEVRHEGHYPSRRPIAISGGALVRESVQLEPLPVDERSRPSDSREVPGTGSGGGVEDTASRPWLTWTLGGAAGVAGATSVGALVFREVHAGRWNDNSRCLEVGRTRTEVCGGERDKVSSAETVALVSGVAAGLFVTGAVLNALGVFGASSAPAEVGLRGCGVGFAGASCFGAF